MTARLRVGRLTSVNPASAKTRSVDVELLHDRLLGGHRVTLDRRAPRARAKSTAARASARLMPRLGKPARVNRQVTAQTLSSALSSVRPSHGTR
jgi:hypothetical protein